MTLSWAQELSMLVHKWEQGNRHSAGAYDEHCETCQILSDLRVFLLLHAGRPGQEPPPAPYAVAAHEAGGRRLFGG
jgi:hypothetical protein